MKPHRFRLAPVLRVRRIEEDRAAAELAAAQRQVGVADDAVATRRTSYSLLPVHGTGTVPAAAFASRRFEHDTAAAAVAAAEAHLRLTELAAAERRAAYLAAAARRTALERLAERQGAEHRYEADRAEAAEVDDLVNARRVRREDQR